MAKEKTGQEKQVSPLPQGRYWLLVEKSNFPDWFEWSQDMGKAVTVKSNEESPDHLFTIFTVNNDAAFFPADRLGLPNHAPANIKSETDVVQAPDVDTPGTEEVLAFVKTAGKVAAGLFLAKLAVDLYRSGRKG